MPGSPIYISGSRKPEILEFQESQTMNPNRTPKTYLTHIPVRSYLEADILSKESTWNILGYVRNAGAGGATANEISQDLELPPSLVYSTLKELHRLEFISILPRGRKKTKDRKKRYLCERTTWGKYRIDPAFADAIEFEGIVRRLTDKVKSPILDVFTQIFDEFNSKRRLRPFLPAVGESMLCPVCGRNHEATEFVYAIILAALDPFITKSPEFRGLLARQGYVTKVS
jgi:hypothetical protein